MEAKDDNSAQEKMKEASPELHAGKNPNRAEAPPKPQPQPAPKKKPDETGNAGQSIAELAQFLKETWIEFRKISWPTRQQVVKETWSVLVLVTMLTVSVLAFDFAVARVVFEPLDKYAKKIGGGVGTGAAREEFPGPLTPMSPQAPVNNPSAPGNALPNNNTQTPTPSNGTPGNTPTKP